MVELFDVVANGKQIHMVTLNFGGMLASKTKTQKKQQKLTQKRGGGGGGGRGRKVQT